MKTTKLSDHITWIEPATMSNFSGCGGLFIDGKVRIGIDTNFGQETPGWLAAAKPDMVVASHYHIDHVAALKHAEESGISRLLIPAGELRMVSDPTNFYHLVDRQGDLQDHWRGLLVRHRFWPSSQVEGFTTEDIAELGAGVIAVPTPGHSPDHTSFFFPDESILFTGDMGIDAFGPWYCWPDCNLRTLVKSLILLQDLSAKTLLTSHGSMVHGESACRAAFEMAITIIRQREEQIANWQEQGLSDEDIVNRGLLYPGHKNYKTDFRHIMGYWEENTLLQHQKALRVGGIFGDHHAG